jgi:hypothetical protein
MKRILFILAVLAVLCATAVFLYPQSDGPWTGYLVTSDGKFVADSSHRTLNDCRRYVERQSGGFCGLDCEAGANCTQKVAVPYTGIR